LTTAQLDELFTLPTEKATLVRYWTLTDIDLAAIHQRRRDRNRLGFALQLCALRYPGRLLRPGELVPAPALRFVADQVDIPPEALAVYAARFQTRYAQLDALRADFGFVGFTPEHRREILAWLLPVALTTTGATTIAATLMDELRRRRLIAPGRSLVDRLVSAAMASAEQQVAHQLTRGLFSGQAEALDALLTTKEGTSLSRLAWARQMVLDGNLPAPDKPSPAGV
jgi:TnpA family transposase